MPTESVPAEQFSELLQKAAKRRKKAARNLFIFDTPGEVNNQLETHNTKSADLEKEKAKSVAIHEKNAMFCGSFLIIPVWENS
jgi:hypothetical protein